MFCTSAVPLICSQNAPSALSLTQPCEVHRPGKRMGWHKPVWSTLKPLCNTHSVYYVTNQKQQIKELQCSTMWCCISLHHRPQHQKNRYIIYTHKQSLHKSDNWDCEAKQKKLKKNKLIILMSPCKVMSLSHQKNAGFFLFLLLSFWFVSDIIKPQTQKVLKTRDNDIHH